MAGFGTSGAYIVIRHYFMLAALSLLLMPLWQQCMPKAGWSPAMLLPGFYRHVVGAVDGRSCPSWPVCSSYASQAVKKHGLLIGSWLMLDRLIHEGDDLHERYGWVRVDGELRHDDPVERNDFWLHNGL